MSDLQWTPNNINQKGTHLTFLNKTIELSMLHIIEDFSVKRGGWCTVFVSGLDM